MFWGVKKEVCVKKEHTDLRIVKVWVGVFLFLVYRVIIMIAERSSSEKKRTKWREFFESHNLDQCVVS